MKDQKTIPAIPAEDEITPVARPDLDPNSRWFAADEPFDCDDSSIDPNSSKSYEYRERRKQAKADRKRADQHLKVLRNIDEREERRYR